MRRRTIFVAAAASTLALASLALPDRRPLIWNVTASVPTGLYWVDDTARLSAGERIAIVPPPRLRELLARRGYLPIGVPLIKRVAAVSGQKVCRFRHGVTINGQLAALARARDALGRPLPRWSGCRVLQHGEVFTLNPSEPSSFDGRYFGILKKDTILGRATPVLTDEHNDGRFVPFAQAGPSHASSTLAEH